MEWKKASKELGDLLASAIEPFQVQHKMMFGSPVYTVKHNMFSGVHGDHIFLRLSETDKKDISSHFPDVKPFEPLKGRVMKEYVIIPESIYRDEYVLRGWLQRSYDFAFSLPVKTRASYRSNKGN
jgi:TfoX/Sxy family transcriptional regulator of competence genes